MIINSIEQFRGFLPTVKGQSLTKYTQPITDACGWFRQKIVGPALMRVIDQMQSEAEAPELFTLAQKVVAYKAYLIAIPKMDVIETANGFAVVNDDTLAPASKDRVKALIDSMTQSLDFAVGELIEYLEDSTEYRDEWKQSPVYFASEGNYITSLRMFRRYGAFKGGYLDYIDTGHLFRNIISRYIEPAISPEYSDELVAQIRDGAIDDRNVAIIGNLRLALTSYYNGDHTLAESCVGRVREKLERAPDDYPAFKGSALYGKILKMKANKIENKSIHVMI